MNTHYTNIMLAIESLEGRIESLEEAMSTPSSIILSKPDVSVEDFSRFLDFGKLKERVL